MKFVAIVAIGTVFVAFGFSYVLESPYYLGHIIGWSGVLLTIGAAYLQHRSTQPFALLVSKNQWEQNDDRLFEIKIPSKLHNKHQILTVLTYVRTNSGYDEFHCSFCTRDNGAVVISANQPFEGKVVIP